MVHCLRFFYVAPMLHLMTETGQSNFLRGNVRHGGKSEMNVHNTTEPSVPKMGLGWVGKEN